MFRTMRLFALSTLLVAGPALATTTETHSGTVAAIDLGRHALTLEEEGPWTGPAIGMVKQSINLTPDTRLELMQRSTGSTPGGWPGGYAGSTLAPTQLHVGDFATAKVMRRGRQAVAVSIDVVRPSGR
jgi:hypothetical protein